VIAFTGENLNGGVEDALAGVVDLIHHLKSIQSQTDQSVWCVSISWKTVFVKINNSFDRTLEEPAIFLDTIEPLCYS
jgi:hypothetical protein